MHTLKILLGGFLLLGLCLVVGCWLGGASNTAVSTAIKSFFVLWPSRLGFGGDPLSTAHACEGARGRTEWLFRPVRGRRYPDVSRALPARSLW